MVLHEELIGRVRVQLESMATESIQLEEEAHIRNLDRAAEAYD